jgi:hypothetical protein
MSKIDIKSIFKSIIEMYNNKINEDKLEKIILDLIFNLNY